MVSIHQYYSKKKKKKNSALLDIQKEKKKKIKEQACLHLSAIDSPILSLNELCTVKYLEIEM